MGLSLLSNRLLLGLVISTFRIRNIRAVGLETADSQNGATGLQTSGQDYFFYQRSEYPRDCRGALHGCPSLNSSGINVIKPDGYPEPFEVYCDNDDGAGGWMVIHRRVDTSVNFTRSWKDYKDGFGFLRSNFWIGNDKLSYITNQAAYQLQADMELANGSSVRISFDSFRISDEWDGFRILSLNGFTSLGDEALAACPRNMGYGSCTCQGTCQEPDACSINCGVGTEACICPSGYLSDSGGCVSISDCPCYWREMNTVIPEGQTIVNEDCTQRRSCTNSSLIRDEEYRCDGNAQCTTRDYLRQCYCNEGYEGDGQECHYTDCTDVYNAGHLQDGIYTVLPTEWSGPPFNVLCEMTNGGGWTVVQQRTGSDRETNFYLDWASYKEGFGSLTGDFWLGNEKIHYLTKQRNYELRVDVRTSGGSLKYAEYSSFRIANNVDKYRLSISGYSGDGGDGFEHSDGMAFSTYDRDADECGTFNCAEKHRGAWWYSNNWCNHRDDINHCDIFPIGGSNSLCAASNLNGNYDGGRGENIVWYYGNNCNLNSAEMKIRPAVQ